MISQAYNVRADPENTLILLTRSKFRSRFHLREKEISYVRNKGFETIREHAVGFITERIAPANPIHDGRQTPMKNHPVFIAQHATATCCRGCLEKWHNIAKGNELGPLEIEAIVNLIMAWIDHEIGTDSSREEI